MILLWAVLIGVAIGYLRRGKIKNLARLNLTGIWLIALALIIQILIFPLGSSKPKLTQYTQVFHIISYLLLLTFVFLNRRYRPIVLMGVGMLSNIIAITANGGYMPASAVALRRAGQNQIADKLLDGGVSGNVMFMGENTKLNFLGDLLYMPEWFPLANAFSIGDLILGLGLIILIQNEMS